MADTPSNPGGEGSSSSSGVPVGLPLAGPGLHAAPQQQMHHGIPLGVQSVPVPVQMNLGQQQQQQAANAHIFQSFWQDQIQQVERETDFKNHELPLARIKKVMKTDEEVRTMMISAEAPVLFAKACEMFILELTMRAWIHTEENKRRTLQRNDIAMAITKTDIFDFLIDIVPREDLKPAKKPDVADYRALGGEVPGFFYVPANQMNFPFPNANLRDPAIQQQIRQLQMQQQMVAGMAPALDPSNPNFNYQLQLLHQQQQVQQQAQQQAQAQAQAQRDDDDDDDDDSGGSSDD